MGTRTLTITDEAYERLKARKEEKDSFSDVILKITKKKSLSGFAGILTEKEAAELESRVKKVRMRSRARTENIRKRMRV